MIQFNKKDIPDKFIIGCSGGIDSVAISHFLASKSYNFGLIHVNNHYLPGDEEAARKVEEFARHIKKKLFLVESSEQYNKGSREEFFREERIQAYKLVAARYDFDYLLTAHHIGDVQEGYLLNFLKGKPEYMPMPPVSHFGSLTVLRPFLRNSKATLEDYAVKNDLTRFVTYDNLNDDTRLMRNFVRKDILPLLNQRVNLEKVVLKKFLLPPERPSAFSPRKTLAKSVK